MRTTPRLLSLACAAAISGAGVLLSVACAQTTAPTAAPQQPIATLPAQPQAPELVTGLPDFTRLVDRVGPGVVSIEAETTTPEKPMQTLTNLRKAIDVHKLCVFACKDGTANHGRFDYWAQRCEGIIYDTSGRGRNRSRHV